MTPQPRPGQPPPSQPVPAPPLVSVVIASYNHARFVEQAIDSVWRQGHRPLELIIVDDGSSDGSFELIEKLAARSPIPMTLVAQANAGPGAAFGRGVAMAQGEWLCILASDDFYAPEFIARNLAEAARLDGDQWVLHANAWLVEVDGRVSGTIDAIGITTPLEGDAFECLVEGGGRLLPGTMFVRRDLFLAAGAFDPTMIAEDCDLQLRLARHARFHYIRDPIFHSRYSPASLGKRPWLWGDSIVRALTKHEDRLGPRLPGLLAKACAKIALSCFEYGRPGDGLHWARQSLGYTRGGAARVRAAGGLTLRTTRAITRLAAYRLVGRERLVRAKRRLTGKAG